MSDRWIVVPNWERFQHYGLARPPTWIKNYASLLHKDEYLDLTLAERGLLHGIWLAFADRRGRVREGADLSAVLHARARRKQLDALNHAGLVAFSASRPLSLTLEAVDTRARASESANGRPVDRRRQKAESWIRNGAAAQIPPGHLAEVFTEEFGISDQMIVDQLIAAAREWSA